MEVEAAAAVDGDGTWTGGVVWGGDDGLTVATVAGLLGKTVEPGLMGGTVTEEVTTEVEGTVFISAAGAVK